MLRRLAVPGEAVAAPLAGLGLPARRLGPAADPGRARPAPVLAAGPGLRRGGRGPARRQPGAARRAPLPGGAPRRHASAIVDLGWSGSLHDALSRLLAAEGAGPVEGYLFGIERVKDATWLDRRHGYFFDHNRGIGADIFARVEDQRGFLEVFCAADHGTVTGLREAGGRIEAELDEAWAEPVAAWGLGTVRGAVAGFAEALALEAVSREATLALRPVIGALLHDFWLDHLELARRRRLPLATLDQQLREAAAALDLILLGL